MVLYDSIWSSPCRFLELVNPEENDDQYWDEYWEEYGEALEGADYYFDEEYYDNYDYDYEYDYDDEEYGAWVEVIKGNFFSQSFFFAKNTQVVAVVVSAPVPSNVMSSGLHMQQVMQMASIDPRMERVWCSRG